LAGAGSSLLYLILRKEGSARVREERTFPRPPAGRGGPAAGGGSRFDVGVVSFLSHIVPSTLFQLLWNVLRLVAIQFVSSPGLAIK
jgi:hypothetical protein